MSLSVSQLWRCAASLRSPILMIVLVACWAIITDGEVQTRDQLYVQGGFERNWIAPMPGTPLPSSSSNTTISSDNTGEKFLVHNWATTFHTIQLGGSDISFVPDPFKPTPSILGNIGGNSSNSNSESNGNATATPDQVLQLDYPKGSFAPSIGPIVGGAQFYAKPFGDVSAFTKMMVSYEVGFPMEFNWTLGGKLPGVYGGAPYDGCSGGIQSTGDNCLTIRIMWRQNGIGEVYAYVPADQRSSFCQDSEVICNDQYGKSIGRGQIYFQPGTWTRIDMVMDLNEPAGSSNGVLQVYLNGTLTINMSNIQYRTSGMVGFQGLLFSSFFGGSDSTYATPVDTSVYFKSLQLSVGSPAALYEGPGTSSASRSRTILGNPFVSFIEFSLLAFTILFLG